MRCSSQLSIAQWLVLIKCLVVQTLQLSCPHPYDHHVITWRKAPQFPQSDDGEHQITWRIITQCWKHKTTTPRRRTTKCWHYRGGVFLEQLYLYRTHVSVHVRKALQSATLKHINRTTLEMNKDNKNRKLRAPLKAPPTLTSDKSEQQLR